MENTSYRQDKDEDTTTENKSTCARSEKSTAKHEASSRFLFRTGLLILGPETVQ